MMAQLGIEPGGENLKQGPDLDSGENAKPNPDVEFHSRGKEIELVHSQMLRNNESVKLSDTGSDSSDSVETISKSNELTRINCGQDCVYDTDAPNDQVNVMDDNSSNIKGNHLMSCVEETLDTSSSKTSEVNKNDDIDSNFSMEAEPLNGSVEDMMNVEEGFHKAAINSCSMSSVCENCSTNADGNCKVHSDGEFVDFYSSCKTSPESESAALWVEASDVVESDTIAVDQESAELDQDMDDTNQTSDFSAGTVDIGPNTEELTTDNDSTECMISAHGTITKSNVENGVVMVEPRTVLKRGQSVEDVLGSDSIADNSDNIDNNIIIDHRNDDNNSDDISDIHDNNEFHEIKPLTDRSESCCDGENVVQIVEPKTLLKRNQSLEEFLEGDVVQTLNEEEGSAEDISDYEINSVQEGQAIPCDGASRLADAAVDRDVLRKRNVAKPSAEVSHLAKPSEGVSHVAKPSPEVSHLAKPSTEVSHLAKPSEGVSHVAKPSQEVSQDSQLSSELPEAHSFPHRDAGQRQSSPEASHSSPARDAASRNRKVQQILSAVSSDNAHNNDNSSVRETLRQLAISREGLVSDSLRRRAWQELLGVSLADIPPKPAPQALHGHRDYEQVVLDVNRSLKRFPPGMAETVRMSMQDQLVDCIMRVLVANSDLHYYQGFHDIVVTFLLVVGEDITFALMQNLSANHLRDFMYENMEKTSGMLHYLYPLIGRSSVEVRRYMETAEVGTMFCLPWLITWYGHVLNDIKDIVRLYDVFIACHPLMPIYLAAAIVLHRQHEILACEPEMPFIHCLLSNIPHDLPFERLISQAGDLFVRYPPDSLQLEARIQYERQLEENRRKREELQELKNRRMKLRKRNDSKSYWRSILPGVGGGGSVLVRVTVWTGAALISAAAVTIINNYYFNVHSGAGGWMDVHWLWAHK